MAAVTICSHFGAQENKVSHCFHCYPIYWPWSDGTRCHELSFLNVEFQAVFSLFSFTFIKRLFSSSLLSAIRMASSAYVRLLIFPQQSWFRCTLVSHYHFSFIFSFWISPPLRWIETLHSINYDIIMMYDIIMYDITHIKYVQQK